MNGTTFNKTRNTQLRGRFPFLTNTTMKKIKSFVVVALLAVLAFNIQHSTCNAESPYKQGEVTADVFGTYSQTKAKLNDAVDREFKNGTYGAGVGFNYFFHRNFALGVDAVIPSAAHATHSFFDQVNLDLTARLPLGDSAFAPYATGGLGRNMETGEYTSHAAVGLEYRIAKAVGVFAEGRYTWGNRDNTDFAQVRAGVRFNF